MLPMFSIWRDKISSIGKNPHDKTQLSLCFHSPFASLPLSLVHFYLLAFTFTQVFITWVMYVMVKITLFCNGIRSLMHIFLSVVITMEFHRRVRANVCVCLAYLSLVLKEICMRKWIPLQK